MSGPPPPVPEFGGKIKRKRKEKEYGAHPA
jgi:hypothetical protein